MSNFTHLHVHTRYSILDGACDVQKLIAKTKELGMNALAITDHGNMFGVLDFKNKCDKAGIKPILGCEMYVAPGSRFDKSPSPGGLRQKNNHLVLLAKNEIGYKNLIKLSSLSFDENAFYRRPRIDKELLFEHSEGLICSSACLAGVIPQLLLNGEDDKAKALALEYKNVFKDDYYIEIQDHLINEDQKIVLPKLVALARELDIKLLATNDVHFINKEDYFAHRILICMNIKKTLNENTTMSYTGEEWLKGPEDMEKLFEQYPDAVANTMEVADKIEVFKLERGPIMPVFDIPESFGKIEDYYKQYPKEKILADLEKDLISSGKLAEDTSEEERKAQVDKALENKGGYDKMIRVKFDFAYLKHLTYEGAKKKYKENLTPEVQSRIDFELDTIEWMGFPGYFLIVQDFINYSRDNLGVIIGPGRGSAAGSVVAYCLGITQIEPIKYDLLFERFLNPDRISLPDIDVDFDDEGREKALQYVQDKYGKSHVAQITTFGSMAAKSAIKDVARVLDYPLADSNRLAGYVPDKAKNLKQAIEMSPELKDVMENGELKARDVLKYALELEGSFKSTGVHACGVIIGPDDISNYVPVTRPDKSNMMATQFEGSLIESVGMIKMDFLGLSNLSIIKDACANIKKTKGIDLDISAISLEDKETLELFSRGDTSGTFQFESEGMKTHLRALKPDKFEDLIAMNALYRPGPMSYIPSFINRKHGDEKIVYTFPQMEEYLSNTYGITVYQEQVMQLSRKLANFTRGESDQLRKAMGKKKKDLMDQLKVKFDKGCQENGLDLDKCNKIWEDWEKFASYAFNKSHATCYAYVAFQTGYLKAHYLPEYMSALLTHNLDDPKQLTKYIDDCQKHNLNVIGPNVNESDINFMVNKKGDILFGLAAIKGVGEQAAKLIIDEREENGPYKDAMDLLVRTSMRTTKEGGVLNKTCVEALVKSGAFDCFTEQHRAQYLYVDDPAKGGIFVDKMVKYARKIIENRISSQFSLFGEQAEEMTLKYPDCEPMSLLDKLKSEKEVITFYISGTPLDIYKYEVHMAANATLDILQEDFQTLYSQGKNQFTFAGIITSSREMTNKNGGKFGVLTLEDNTSSYEFLLYGKDYIQYSQYMRDNLFVVLKAAMIARRSEDKDTKEEKVTYRLNIRSITLLEDYFKEYAKGVLLNIDLKQLNQGLVDNIIQTSKKYKGSGIMMFDIIDNENQTKFRLSGTKHKVDLHEIAPALEKMCENHEIMSFNFIPNKK